MAGFLLSAAQRGHLSIVKLLLDKGAKIEDDILFFIENFQIVKYLIKRGANPKATYDETGNEAKNETGKAVVHESDDESDDETDDETAVAHEINVTVVPETAVDPPGDATVHEIDDATGVTVVHESYHRTDDTAAVVHETTDESDHGTADAIVHETESKTDDENDHYSNTLLHRQCKNRNFKGAKYLIQHYNSDVNAKNRKGQTPLHLACKKRNNLKMVKFLIGEQNADPSITCNRGKTALLYAAESSNLTTIRYLIEERHADPVVTCKEGETALHCAARNCDRRVLSYLIEDQKLDIEATDSQGNTVLHCALDNYLGEKPFEFNFILDFNTIPVLLAAKAQLLTSRDKNNRDHLFDWIKNAYKSEDEQKKKEDDEDRIISCLQTSVQRFQEGLAKKNALFIQPNPLLNIVCLSNRVDIAEYIFKQDLCNIEKHFHAEEADLKRMLLLKSYIQFSCKESVLGITKFWFQEIYNRQEPFHFDGSLLVAACKCHSLDVFQYLLEDEKAKDEAAEFLKDFPLDHACKKGSLEMVQYLIEAKQLDVSKERTTYLTWILRRGSMEMVQYLSEKNLFSLVMSDEKRRASFGLACSSRSLELVKYISQDNLEQCVNFADEKFGLTALHLACASKDLEPVKFLVKDVKANIHAVDVEGRTPLHLACLTQSHKLLQFFVNQGADVLAKDKSGKIPLQVATSQQFPSNLLILT